MQFVIFLLCVCRALKAKRDAYVSRLNQIYRNNLDKVTFFISDITLFIDEKELCVCVCMCWGVCEKY